jgi:hypothetical protein
VLTEDGKISFVSELLDAVTAFLTQYEAEKGVLRNDLERGLVLAYALGVMCCDLDAVWDGLSQAQVFEALHPRTVFEDCAANRDQAFRMARRAQIVEELRRRGLLGD